MSINLGKEKTNKTNKTNKNFVGPWRWLSRFFLPVLCILFLYSTVLATTYPKPTGNYVNDFAGIIDRQHKQILEKDLRRIEKETTAQIVIVTLANTKGEDGQPGVLKEYATGLFKEWRIGHAENKKGLLIITSLDPRRIEIETGDGLEGDIPDITAKKIIDEQMVPAFKRTNYGAGFVQAVRALELQIKGEAGFVSPDKHTRSRNRALGWHGLFWPGLVVLAAVGWFMSRSRKPLCPQCNSRRFVEKTRTDVLTQATAFKRGVEQITYYCSRCNNRWIEERYTSNIKNTPYWMGGGYFGGGGWGGGSSGGGGSWGGDSGGGFSGGGGTSSGGGAGSDF